MLFSCLTVVDVLQRAAPAVLHADPQLVSPQVGSVIGDDVRVPAVLHHEDLLLDQTEVIALLQLDHLDRSEFPG